MPLRAQDRYTLKAANGISFSDIKGYETWPDIAVSEVEEAAGSGGGDIVANPTMINAHRDGIPGNGKRIPDGSKIVKIEWSPKNNPEAPCDVKVPDTLRRVGVHREGFQAISGDERLGLRAVHL
jgi:hypothetical protein